MTRILKENEDYELIPGQNEHWNVRILDGQFTETVIEFEKLKLTEDGQNLKFSFEIISSPDVELSKDNIDLQVYAKDVLSTIMHNFETDEGFTSDDRNGIMDYTEGTRMDSNYYYMKDTNG
jgi:hypothetical protein